MPVGDRKYYYLKCVDIKKKENEAIDAARTGKKTNTENKPVIPMGPMQSQSRNVR